VAWTQADVDAKKAELAAMKKAISLGDKSITNFDLDQQMKLLAMMESDVSSSGTSGESLGRCTLASTARV
jgi:hypothetical protein